MADVRWTEEQQKVIDTRNRNLLVSAAAGSGKTAVLVERIIRMITDEENPVDIDRLLVMTFTKAAAAEMRERIGAALEQRLEGNPGDQNLERQMTLIHHARITTIDSFCLRLLREHFNELDVDPGFRIADEGEILLIQTDVMKDLLEDYYGREDERFIRFVDTYASGKADGGLEDYILQVWDFAQSSPWPMEWIERCRKEVEAEDAGDPDSFSRTPWMGFLLDDVRKQAAEWAEQLREAAEAAGEEDGPQAYLPMLLEDIRNAEELLAAETYEQVYEVLERPLFGRLSAVRGKNVDPSKKELAAGIRNRVKDAVKKLKSLYVPGDISSIFSDMTACREPIFMLLELAEEFAHRFAEAKKDKNIVDFGDMEHFALEILTGRSEDHSPGPVADELSRFYEEILVDEYQDSNLVQETMISCLSRERFGTPNVFMVGDVKQSIYRFRLAKPELFLEKYEAYQKEDGLYQKIELHKNFRSRPDVLKSVNDVFYGIMTKSLGNIRYTEDAALHPGADYPEPAAEGAASTELFLLNTGEEIFSGMEDERADYTAREAEARLIASKIRELTDPETGMRIWNQKKGRYELVKKSDIVILLRSLSGWAEEFLSVLGAEGIPAFAESRTGYFAAVEVETVLNMLSLIDNPMQDIPLAGVLKSPMGGMTDQELASVNAAFRRNPEKGQDRGMYAAVQYYRSLNRGNEIAKKLERFWKLLLTLRAESEYLPVHRLIYRIFELTGYYDYVSAMPAGSVRQANLNMLVQKASAYEKTSYQSLFDFTRYIEKLKKYKTDFGEASQSGENEDTVRIMSIHKSKGLEFPVVFLAGAGKQFNRQDSRGKILIDEALGIGTDFFDCDLKVKAPTLKKNVLGRRSNLESMGEELRILYVAMTRAKEKLIVTAADRYLENRLEKWGSLPDTGRQLPFTFLSAAGSYLDWFLMASERAKGSIRITRVSAESLLREELTAQGQKAEAAGYLRYLRDEAASVFAEGGQWEERLNQMLCFTYPYEADVTLHAKISVSELKERGQFVDDGESDFLPSIPVFMRTGDKKGGEVPESDEVGRRVTRGPGGAVRGTAYHRVLELLCFREISSVLDIRRQLEEIGREERMDREALKLVRISVLERFMKSSVAQRMKTADEAGKLYKERQFVMGVPASAMDEAESEELVLVQGIIDAWFEEPDGLVLVDYKTDRLSEGEEQILMERYGTQMAYYCQALSQITGKQVKEAVIYSLTLQKEIRVI